MKGHLHQVDFFFFFFDPVWSDTCTLWPPDGSGWYHVSFKARHERWMQAGTFDAVTACSRCSCSCLPRGVTRWPYQNQAPLHCGGETRAHCCLRHAGIKIRNRTSKHNGLAHARTHNLKSITWEYLDHPCQPQAVVIGAVEHIETVQAERAKEVSGRRWK